jgi:streptomycin 6-kinase
MPVLGVPPAVRNKALALGAHDWLNALPDLVADLERAWSISVGRVFADATEALVAEATVDGGMPAVLKVPAPTPDRALEHEVAVLRRADGDGCVQLLRYDEERGALLLERLGPSLSHMQLPTTTRHELLCAAAMRLWRPAPDLDLPSGADKARSLASFIQDMWEGLDRPCSEDAVDLALRCADRRRDAYDEERAVLVHGDVHQWNALHAGEEVKLIDPDGLLAEREYDLGILMREDPEELVGVDTAHRAHWLADRTGTDARAIWEWGVVERMSTGLLCTLIEMQPVGRQMLAIADQVAASDQWATQG